MAKSSSADLAQVAAATAALRSFWQMGRSSWDKVRSATDPDHAAARKKQTVRKRTKPQEAGYVHGNKTEVLKQAAADEGMSYDTLQKAWRAARLYTREQIEELCRLIEEHQARFGPTHLTRVMAVADAKQRDALTRRAIRGR